MDNKKVIRLERSELIWQTRVNFWDKTEWDSLLAWLKEKHDNYETLPEEQKKKEVWLASHYRAYEQVKDLTWDEAVAEFDKWHNPQTDPSTCLRWEDSYGDSEHTFTVFFGDWLLEYIRQDNYDANIETEDYADDYSEFIDLVAAKGDRA